ncbi:RhoGAP domain containing protein [Entamoeba histolytica HM-1:IMSS-B]|uniref:RhoGAP domain containing protein n=6 Tax=Entamoeba histolytica TaxID=5759 RepID=B1N3W6_ENTH1|nr:RhoGAP domain containing protein [Entamoeba histolytica HM-1:IMSS]EMD47834.1 RhoGAP domain containing protein [Entamoeba histolytica KU27]EMH76355.1 RhoGAP domain containing protein [Entamoeba histolytica HM-1:IMSS-B]EMS17855.1 RhoGAP domain containing protein [Entamoeba histolytica HM-3:IMSS]ENY62358.1 RhoGAP domain containing protein [Entamoeba histolytica HM-1:IMSS-A]GAT96889.1 rhogap domain containing protein [Entamoeba histolytica]|eukprot:XP_001913882.1 RhoGAP domain containing protein [Entamoeba histolytica HM-1:IMSS]
MANQSLLDNQLHIIGETKFKEFSVINNFWTKQHDFIKEWNEVYNTMNKVLRKETDLIEATFYNNSVGFVPEDGEVIISALSYINNSTQMFASHVSELFSGVLDSLDMKFKEIEKEFKSAGYSQKSKQGDIVNEKIITLYHSLSTTTSLTITKMFTDMLDNYYKYFGMGITFIEESDKFKRMKETINKRITDEKLKSQPQTVTYANVPISAILKEENRTTRDLPRVIENIHMCLMKNGLNTKGIFRESTATANVIQEIYMRMSVTNFLELPPDVTAAVYKKFLRELPNHIFNQSQTMELAERMTTIQNTGESSIELMKNAVDQLPEELKTLFIHLLRLCYKIAQNEKINSMGSKNLSVCLTPSVFSISEGENGQYALPSLLNLLTNYINHFNELFPRYADPINQQKVPRISMVGGRTPQRSTASTETNKSIPQQTHGNSNKPHQEVLSQNTSPSISIKKPIPQHPKVDVEQHKTSSPVIVQRKASSTSLLPTQKKTTLTRQTINPRIMKKSTTETNDDGSELQEILSKRRKAMDY